MQLPVILVVLIHTFLPLLLASNRTAVCITGQVRSTNLPWEGDFIWFGPRIKQLKHRDGTPGDTIIENVFSVLAAQGFDVFMNVATTGEGSVLQPIVGDKSVCSSLHDKTIFSTNSTNPNKFFCQVERSFTHLNTFVKSYPNWRKYVYKDNEAEHEFLLQQMYDIYRCNEGIRQYSASTGVQYKYKMRIRPDSAWGSPIPRMEDLDFGEYGNNNSDCKSIIRISSRYHYLGGNEDTFAVGLSSDMDVRLDEYVDFMDNVHIMDKQWNNEQYLQSMLLKKKICLKDDDRLIMYIVRAAEGISFEPDDKFIKNVKSNGRVKKFADGIIGNWHDMNINKTDIDYHVVIANDAETVGQWLKHVKGSSFIYQRKDPNAPLYLPDKGNECLPYVEHIINNFDQLPPLVFFLRGIVVDHCPGVGSLFDMNGSALLEAISTGYIPGYYPLSNVHLTTNSSSPRFHIIEECVTDIWSKYQNSTKNIESNTRQSLSLPQKDINYEGYCCSNFVAKRENIIYPGKDFWQFLQDSLLNGHKCVSTRLREGAHFCTALEYLWPALLGGNFSIPVHAYKPLCKGPVRKMKNYEFVE